MGEDGILVTFLNNEENTLKKSLVSIRSVRAKLFEYNTEFTSLLAGLDYETAAYAYLSPDMVGLVNSYLGFYYKYSLGQRFYYLSQRRIVENIRQGKIWSDELDKARIPKYPADTHSRSLYLHIQRLQG